MQDKRTNLLKHVIYICAYDKGYGFIEYLDGEDIFVHYSAIKQKGYKSLSEGQLVEFELVRTPKGLQAINVVTVEKSTV